MPIHDWTRVDAGIFHAFHHNWITMLSSALNSGLLPDDYYALPEQIAGGPVPDVLTLQRPVRATSGRGPRTGGLALDEAPPQVPYRLMAETGVYARKANRIAVRHVSGHEVVATVEFVSPGNKASAKAVRTFVKKAAGLLASGVHLLIVDLFPPTRRDPAGLCVEVWEEVGGADPQSAKGKPLGCASFRADAPPEAFFQPLAVDAILPAMPLFLTKAVYVNVPLESSYCAAWELVPAYWRGVVSGVEE